MNAHNTTCPNCGKRLTSGALMGLCPDCLLNTGFGTIVGGANSRAIVPPEPLVVERIFPGLQVLELIGQGGMGTVYKARQKQIDRIVALKILRAHPKGDAEFAARFQREARALAKLQHANIVTLYESGEAGGQFYLLMEYIDGVTLRQLLDTRHISPKEALAIVPQICDALQYAHDRGVVHRDIKPENILINRQGTVKIADFGVAKILGSAEGSSKLVGTPRYMAPEQILSPLTVDNRADIYALGVVFYQMLTGEVPAGKFEPLSRKMFFDVRLDEVVLRALEKKPERRYQQVSALKTRIETLVSEVTGERNERPQRRVPLGLLAGTLAILGCLAAGLWVFSGMGNLPEKTQIAVGPEGKPLIVSLDGPLQTAEGREEPKNVKNPSGAEAEKKQPEAGGKATEPNLAEDEAIAKALMELKGAATVGAIKVNDLAAGGLATNVHTDPKKRSVMLESVYVVRASRHKVDFEFSRWDPSRDSSTKVGRHQEANCPDFRSFVSLAYTTTAEPMRALTHATENLPKSAISLNLSEQEIARFKPGTPDGTVIPPYVSDFWLGVLKERAFAFRPQNWRAPEIIIPAYRKGEETIDPQKDLGELDLTPKFPGKHWYRPEAKYWELINLGKEGHGGVLVLGARYLSPAASGISVTHDLQYYVSGGYYASVSSQRISEFSLGGKPAVLVWQKDYFLVPEFPSAAELEELSPLELQAWKRSRHLPKLSGEVVVPLAKAKIKAFQKAMEALEAKREPLATASGSP